MDKTEGTGERVGGYRVVRRLATGGTSEVLLAKAEGPHGFERSVVLKLLLSQYKHDDDFKGMFAREAAAYARLSHPAIVRLYDFFSNNDQLVMVLEYIDGPPLSRLRGMLKAVGQQFDDATALYVGGTIFDALAAAHAASDDNGDPAPVIHRDVNPSNVLIPWDGQVKLADFGIAKVTGVSHQSSAGLIKGTYGYMAPEQVKGETVTPRADVYAGAIILWEMLTKRRAFIRGALPEIEVLRELAEPRIVSIDVLRPELDKNVRDALKRALEPRAEKRNMTAEEMVSTLRSAMPPEEGRERLAKALASVRHEPKPMNTSIPPPMGASSDDQQTGKIFPRGMLPARPGMLPPGASLPRPTPAPRPAMGVSRKTSPYGAPLPPGASGSTTPHAAPALGATRKASALGEGWSEPPATLTPSEVPPPTEAQPGYHEARQPLSEPGLASLLEPSDPNPMPNPSSLGVRAAVPVFDSLVEPPELVKATGRDSEKLRLATPGVDHGSSLRQAIDEILQNVPSNVPPDVFPRTDPPQAASAESPTKKDAKTVAERVRRELGQLPAAPAPLTASAPAHDLASTLVVGSSSPAKPMPSSFPAMNRTLQMNAPAPAEIDAADKLTERPPPQLISSSTAPMPAVAPPMPAVAPPKLSPSTAKMRAFVVPPAAVASVPPPPGAGSSPPGMGSSPPATLPLGAMSSLPAVASPPGGPSSSGSHPPVQSSQASPQQASPQQVPHSAPPGSQQGAPLSAPHGAPPSAALHGGPISAPPHGAPPSAAPHGGPISAPPNRLSSPSASGAHAPPAAPESTHPPRRGLPVFALAMVLLVAIVTGVAGTVAYVRWQKSRVVTATPPQLASAAATPATATAGSPFVAPEATTLTTAPTPTSTASASPSASASASALASASASASALASASASASPSAAPPADDVPPTMGRVKTAGAVPGRRIFVDERTLGQTPDAVLVKCGARAIRLGSTGSTQTIDVPCGGEIVVGDR